VAQQQQVIEPVAQQQQVIEPVAQQQYIIEPVAQQQQVIEPVVQQQQAIAAVNYHSTNIFSPCAKSLGINVYRVLRKKSVFYKNLLYFATSYSSALDSCW